MRAELIWFKIGSDKTANRVLFASGIHRFIAPFDTWFGTHAVALGVLLPPNMELSNIDGGPVVTNECMNLVRGGGYCSD